MTNKESRRFVAGCCIGAAAVLAILALTGDVYPLQGLLIAATLTLVAALTA